ncbi:histidine phosphatase superfamily [Hypoxylon sp. FL1857]|nr:histidine phosphatase superfamily [Hypoxylon sp. FL1857]
MDTTGFTEDQVMVRETIDAICSRFPNTYWQRHDLREEDPSAFHAAMAVGGWLGIALPEELGGAGLGISEAVMMMQTITESGAGMAGAQAIHANVYATQPLAKFGSKRQLEDTIPNIISGRWRTCFGVTEPDTGLDTLQLRTTAKKQSDGSYNVTGQKIWITCAQVARKMILLARTAPLETVNEPTKGLSLFCIDLDKDAPGLHMRRIQKMGGRAVDANEVFFDNYKIPADTLIGLEHEGWKIVLHGMNAERCLIAGEALGLGYAALKKAAEYARERVVFQRPIGRNQGVAHPLADAYMHLEAAKLATYHAARLYDNSKRDTSIKQVAIGAAANTAKYLAAEAAFTACERAVMTHGGMGYATEYDVERWLRDCLVPRIAPTPVSTDLLGPKRDDNLIYLAALIRNSAYPVKWDTKSWAGTVANLLMSGQGRPRTDRRWRLALILSTVSLALLTLRFWNITSTILPGTIWPTTVFHDEFDLYKHLGHLSPFFVPSNTPQTLLSGTPPGCTVSKGFLIHRHGSRYPHPDELAVIQSLADYINNNSALFSKPQAQLPDVWSFLIGGWNHTLGTDDLTAPGRKQLFDHGVALRLEYPDLYTETDVLAGDEDRVVESARWFMDGYYGRDSNSTADLELVVENGETVSWITPHETCARWDSSLGEDLLSEWRDVYLPPIRKRINDTLSKAYPGVNFTDAHVHGMLYACAYETAALGVDSSPWCRVFLPEEILKNEYEYDLRMRGFSGYGLPGDMGSVLGSLLVSNATNFLQQDAGPKLSLGFGHDKTIALGLTALGLASDKSYPSTGPVDPDRAWRAAKLMPFAAYMFWKRLDCDEGERIQLVLNGANFDLGPTGCESDEYGSCVFDDFLGTAKVQAARNLTHGDARWKAACH